MMPHEKVHSSWHFLIVAMWRVVSHDHCRDTWLPRILFMEQLVSITVLSAYVKMKLPCGPVSENL